MAAWHAVTHMWRKLLLGLTALLLAVVATALALKPTELAPEVIAASVKRDPTLLARAWQLPAAAGAGFSPGSFRARACSSR